MALGSQLPVGLDLDTDSRLESIAQRPGTTKSAIIRMLAKRFVDTCVSEDGTVTLPANIQAMLNDRGKHGELRPAPTIRPPDKYKNPRGKKYIS